ncbi:Inner membrane protein YebZ [Serratia liquefaciens]|jgi:putative copper resistance protein D|uniref:Copper resistance protein D n=1 Tax=Serratia liquefaciens TaxID=614 RepID=A0ABX7CXZ3_SERLI|nr:copper homeostasis membrane protein CopD [Serratia liquefaciens]AKE10970.1 copper resistance protein CopD [Serratia liquefaciens]MBF8104671.1 copper homeostasis membrane protein CopD [Serratia liquefaciens]MBV0841418.1 copper homeostasis membrane protein CopD [Serratia liquefaciens]MDU5484497.1 copper homeostasis membrane protein CopD [Serratia liquefaciens]QQU53487.1 copper homeostasis membrane protein CopD [Serratia liquefaciens]
MSLATLFVLCRFVHFAAVMLMFGSSLFTALLSPQRLSPYLTRDVRPLLVSCTWLAGLSAIALLAIQAGQMGDGWADTWRLDVWWAVLGTTFGEVWRWHLGISMLALLSLWLAEPRRTQLLALLSTLLLVSMAFIGHAAMHGGGLGALHRFNHALHLLAAGYWFGSLLPLLVCLRYLAQTQWRSDAVTTLIRFSRWGHLAVALVLLTGVINSLIILGSWPLDVDSPYQRLLLFKTALVALMVMVALANRYAVVPAMSSMPRLAQRGLVLACWAELGLGAVVLLLVSLFATYAPV